MVSSNLFARAVITSLAFLVCVLATQTSVHAAPSKKQAPASVKNKNQPPLKARVAAGRHNKAVSKSVVSGGNGKSRALMAASVGAVVAAGWPSQLDVKSNAAMVMDLQTQEVLFDKNAQAVLPIASLTKLMTALVITEANLPLGEMVGITEADVDTLKGSSSRLAVGTVLSRGELLHLALMSSDALGRTFPGGLDQFTARMNAKAKALGMASTHYVDPTGLSPANRSSAKDLAVLVAAAYEEPLIRELSTSTGHEVAAGRRTLHYRNTNHLVSNPNWDIGLQKTGYIAEAGRCLVMQATVAGRKLVMVFLDSAGKFTRVADAERVKKWVEAKS
jgi:serine-type D-Ala-D-Ala endopeptidase (penicillin-binding protein 7)